MRMLIGYRACGSEIEDLSGIFPPGAAGCRFFTDMAEASNEAICGFDSPSVVEACIFIENPWVCSDPVYVQNITSDEIDRLKSLGHDGAYLVDDNDIVEYLAFDQNQVMITDFHAPNRSESRIMMP